MRRRSLVVLFIFSTATILLGQNGPDDDPDSAPGYVNNVFHSSSVDSVNLYNGQLTVPVPIGPSYPVGPNLRFQAQLTYNSRVIEYGNPDFQGTEFYQPLVGNPSLGIGWNFQVGKIGWCGGQGGICFFRSDGAEVTFNQADGAYWKTTDASRYRLYAPNSELGAGAVGRGRQSLRFRSPRDRVR